MYFLVFTKANFLITSEKSTCLAKSFFYAQNCKMIGACFNGFKRQQIDIVPCKNKLVIRKQHKTD